MKKMSEKKIRRKSLITSNSSLGFDKRVFEAEAAALNTLRLIAAPDPQDDISDDELAYLSHGSSFSSQLIRQIIDCIKAI
jgi:hypothetical protein